VRVNHSNGSRSISIDSLISTSKRRIVLWHLRGSLDDLACVASPTSYGYTLGLELAGESILVELQPSVERLADKAARLEQWLLGEGWTPVTEDSQ
jgi:hypothetical protein